MRTPVLGLVLLLVGPACGGEAPPADRAASWDVTIAWEAGVKLGGCDVGDVDPTSDGNEIAAVAVDGRIFLCRHDGGGWHGEEIAKVGGEMIQCRIADADPTRDGHELVVVGMKAGDEGSGGPGAAHLVHREDGAWRVETIAEDTALVHGVAVGDFDAAHPGNEVATVGFSRKVRVWGRDADGWRERWQQDLPAPGKTAVALGDGVVVAAMSPDVHLYRVVDAQVGEGTVADDVVLGTPGAAQARIATDGERVLVACDDGGLRLLGPAGIELIHKESEKLRGAVLADLDPSRAGVEAATAGYGRTVTLLYAPRRSGEDWEAVTLWRDTERLHHLAAGELDAATPGPELVAVGYSGRVIVAARRNR